MSFGGQWKGEASPTLPGDVPKAIAVALMGAVLIKPDGRPRSFPTSHPSTAPSRSVQKPNRVPLAGPESLDCSETVSMDQPRRQSAPTRMWPARLRSRPARAPGMRPRPTRRGAETRCHRGLTVTRLTFSTISLSSSGSFAPMFGHNSKAGDLATLSHKNSKIDVRLARVSCAEGKKENEPWRVAYYCDWEEKEDGVVLRSSER